MTKEQEWLTHAILELMEERRQQRNRNFEKYKELHKKVLRAIKGTKERWIQQTNEARRDTKDGVQE